MVGGRDWGITKPLVLQICLVFEWIRMSAWNWDLRLYFFLEDAYHLLYARIYHWNPVQRTVQLPTSGNSCNYITTEGNISIVHLSSGWEAEDVSCSLKTPNHWQHRFGDVYTILIFQALTCRNQCVLIRLPILLFVCLKDLSFFDKLAVF